MALSLRKTGGGRIVIPRAKGDGRLIGVGTEFGSGVVAGCERGVEVGCGSGVMVGGSSAIGDWVNSPATDFSGGSRVLGPEGTRAVEVVGFSPAEISSSSAIVDSSTLVVRLCPSFALAFLLTRFLQCPDDPVSLVATDELLEMVLLLEELLEPLLCSIPG